MYPYDIILVAPQDISAPEETRNEKRYSVAMFVQNFNKNEPWVDQGTIFAETRCMLFCHISLPKNK